MTFKNPGDRSQIAAFHSEIAIPSTASTKFSTKISSVERALPV